MRTAASRCESPRDRAPRSRTPARRFCPQSCPSILELFWSTLQSRPRNCTFVIVTCSVNSGAFLEHVTITNVQLRGRVAVASVFLVIGVGILATLARAALPVGEL